MFPFRTTWIGKICLLGLFWMMSCTRSSHEEKQQLAKEHLEQVYMILTQIRSPQDFSRSFTQLQARFENIAELLLDQDESIPLTSPDMHILNQKVKMELTRIYHLEGGRDWIEKSQEKALGKLEMHHKRSFKGRSKLSG